MFSIQKKKKEGDTNIIIMKNKKMQLDVEVSPPAFLYDPRDYYLSSKLPIHSFVPLDLHFVRDYYLS